MINREKIIKGLRCLISMSDCTLCPYSHNKQQEYCLYDIREDVVELLKEREPRVMTLDELKQFEGSPCWFESHGTYMGKEGFWIIPAMFRMFSAGMIMSYTFVLNGAGDCSELGLSAYNKAWRCWTAKPTDEQRQAVTWE